MSFFVFEQSPRRSGTSYCGFLPVYDCRILWTAPKTLYHFTSPWSVLFVGYHFAAPNVVCHHCSCQLCTVTSPGCSARVRKASQSDIGLWPLYPGQCFPSRLVTLTSWSLVHRSPDTRVIQIVWTVSFLGNTVQSRQFVWDGSESTAMYSVACLVLQISQLLLALLWNTRQMSDWPWLVRHSRVCPDSFDFYQESPSWH